MQGTIVLAEDSRTVRRMVEIALARHPYSIETAEDGEAALALIRARSPALVLVDTALPGVDGYELASRVKDDPAISGVPVLLLAGQNQPLDMLRAQQAGAIGHLVKPFLTQDLIDAVYRAMELDAPEGSLFRGPTTNIPLAKKPTGPPAPPPVALVPPVAAPPPPPARAPAEPMAPPPAPSAAANPFEGVSNPFDQNEATRPFLKQRPALAEAPPPATPEPVPAAAVPAAPAPVAATASPVEAALADLSKDAIEKILWEIVPPLAEAILKEEIARVVRERMAAQ